MTSSPQPTDDPGAVQRVPSAGELLGHWQPVWDSSPALVAVVWGPRHVLVYQNAASARVVGARRRNVPLREAFPEFEGAPLTVLDRVRSTGVSERVERGPVPLAGSGAGPLHLHYVVAPLGAAAPYAGVVMTGVDRSAQVRAEQATARARLLALMAERMNAAADADTALQVLTDTLVPALADVAAVYVSTGNPEPGALRDGSPPVAISLSRELLAAAGPPPPPGRTAPSPWDAALAAGRTVFIELDDETHRSAVSSSSDRWLASADGHNMAVIPLVVAGEFLGALLLLSAGGRDPYLAEDTPFLEDVAARAGAAVSHVRTVQRERQTALTLQRALLPADPPQLPGLQIAARYVAGSVDVEVGGDWWDVHRLADGRVGVGVGDVSGRGVPAAVLMGQARAGMRVAGHAALPPAQVLTVLDQQVTDLVVLDQGGDHRLPAKFATAAYAVIDPAEDLLRVANAGHPPLLLRYPDGRVVPVDAPPGPPLGLGAGGYEERSAPFPVGSLLVAFTDGLIESRQVDIDTGTAAVVDALLAAAADVDLDVLADALLALADGQDDTALILVRRTA